MVSETENKPSNISITIESATGQVKEMAGKVLGSEQLKEEGLAQQHSAAAKKAAIQNKNATGKYPLIHADDL